MMHPVMHKVYLLNRSDSLM